MLASNEKLGWEEGGFYRFKRHSWAIALDVDDEPESCPRVAFRLVTFATRQIRDRRPRWGPAKILESVAGSKGDDVTSLPVGFTKITALASVSPPPSHAWLVATGAFTT